MNAHDSSADGTERATAFFCSGSPQSAKITRTSRSQMVLEWQITERSIKTAPIRVVTCTPASISKSNKHFT